MAANDGLGNVECIDGPHHVGVARSCAEADACIVIDEGKVVLHIKTDGLCHLLLPSIFGGTGHIELTALERPTVEHAGAAVEMFFEENLVARPDDKVVEISLLGLVAVVVILAETKVAISEIARAGINQDIIDIGLGRIGIRHFYREFMLLAVLDADARDGCFGEERRVAAAPAMGTEANTAVRVDLPHIIVAVVGSGEDESSGKRLDVEHHLDLIIRDGTLCFGALLVGAGLDPLRAVPGISRHQASLEIGFLAAGGRSALIVGYGDAPIVASLGSRRETFSLDEHALIGIDGSRFPNDTSETGVAGNLHIVACLHHAALLALELPGEVNHTLVNADRIVIVFRTEFCDVEGKNPSRSHTHKER